MFARDPVRPAVHGHLLHRRALPLHHLRRSRLPALRRDVLLVPEGHREHLLRGARPDSVSGSSSSARSCTFFPMHILGLLGMTRRVYTYLSGFGWDPVQRDRDDRQLHHARSGSCSLLGNLLWSYFRGRPRRSRPVPRRDAGMDDLVAAAAVQLRRHPDCPEPVPELGRAQTASKTSASLARGRPRSSTPGHENTLDLRPSTRDFVEIARHALTSPRGRSLIASLAR